MPVGVICLGLGTSCDVVGLEGEELSWECSREEEEAWSHILRAFGWVDFQDVEELGVFGGEIWRLKKQTRGL